MNELSIEELLLIISDKDSNKPDADKAFTVLYHRFNGSLYTSVTQHLKSKGVYNKEFADQLFSNVLCEIYLNPLSFNFDGTKNKSEEDSFKAWMFVIARNEFADILRASIKHSNFNVLTADGDLTDPFVESDIEEEVLSDNRKLIDRALTGLTERERHILLACYDFYEKDKYTPSETLDNLCEIWGTTRANVRQIKKRALDKVMTYIDNPINVQKRTS